MIFDDDPKQNAMYVVAFTGMAIGGVIGIANGFVGAGIGGAILGAIIGGFVGCFLGAIVAAVLGMMWEGWEKLVEDRFMPVIGAGIAISVLIIVPYLIYSLWGVGR